MSSDPSKKKFVSTARRVNRRKFVSSTVAAVALPQALSAANPVQVGIIGVGNIGTRHLERRLLPMERRDGIVKVVAACDIYDRAKFRAREMIGLGKKDVHHDYLELIGRDDVDAVVIATPEHWHAPMALAALEAGKDVYLEKPMTRTIAEAKQVAEAVETTGRVLQVGSQWVSDPAYLEAKRFISDGVVGDVVWMQSSYSSNHPDGVWQYYVDEEATPIRWTGRRSSETRPTSRSPASASSAGVSTGIFPAALRRISCTTA